MRISDWSSDVCSSDLYLYEYQVGNYPSLKDALPGRDIQPTHEMVSLADYRLRYAAYRADPDLQRLHALFPMIAQWDDHEFANDVWKGGAENHNEGEGDRSEEHTSELQSLMRISYAVFCLKKKQKTRA